MRASKPVLCCLREVPGSVKLSLYVQKNQLFHIILLFLARYTMVAANGNTLTVTFLLQDFVHTFLAFMALYMVCFKHNRFPSSKTPSSKYFECSLPPHR